MKKFIMILSIIILFVSCGDENSSDKVINISDYYTADNVEIAASFIESEDGISFAEKLKLALENVDELKDSDFKANLLISETGELDKIIIIESGKTDEVNRLIINELEDEKFTPAKRKGMNVKSQLRWNYPGSEYLTSVEKLPEPIGGINEIAKNVIYPEEAKKAGIEGKVFLNVFINEEGNVDKLVILKSSHPALDSAAIEAVSKVKFTPGKKDGIPVKTQIAIPIKFQLK
ncbi:MAG: energy transducer TonB [Melioribacteraceae bacterium]|nr:energy transducer TonB [Melioribacteraceae bacterium]MCF8354740.1 energy transducer TonB [Melioribacteraceae bacterium]MCF8393238.1 energy transducer TonB [Melioribacteraceae bacterium]MCF8417539.1 energy transducer TonB [Melioribacteraceae bacterium]